MSATLDDPSAWRPVGETSTDILNDAVDLIATLLCGFGCGIAFALYCVCARKLYYQLTRKGERQAQARFMLTYITILMLLGLLYFASNARVLQLGYVNFRNFPTGPYQYTVFTFSSPDSLLGVVTYFIVSWMTDALLIWRVYVLYSATSYAKLAIALPCLLYLASVATSIVIIYESSRPSQSFWSTVSVPFGLAYYSITAALTVLATLLMTARLLNARNQHVQLMGNASHGMAKEYLSIAAMLVESSTLYATWSIIFIGLYASNHPMQNVFLGSLTDVSIIALLLIVFRVSRGKAWQGDTEKTLSTMKWNQPASGGRAHKPLFRGGAGSSNTQVGEAISLEVVPSTEAKKYEEV